MKGTILVNGGRIRYTDSDGDGPPVVLLHGDWTDSGVWAPLIPLLRENSRVISYDELAYGGSLPPTAPYTRLGNLRAVLDGLKLTRTALVAHSGGADAALGLALSEPERVAALVLIAPGTHDYPWPADDPYIRSFGRHARGGMVELGLRTWAAASPAAGRPAAETGVTRAARAQFRRAVGAWDKTSLLCMDDPAVYERLGEVAAPTVVMVGEAEYPMVGQSSRDIAGRIEGAKLTVVPGADHLLPLHSPGAVANAVRDVAR
jgi:pimeloyl-ACP methyl ester carboxylesterase